MHCHRCGHQVEDDERYCQYCGEENTLTKAITNMPKEEVGAMEEPFVESPRVSMDEKHREDSGIGFAILSVFIPILGLIFYFMWKNTYPRRAKNCLIAFFIAFIWNFFVVMNGNF